MAVANGSGFPDIELKAVIIRLYNNGWSTERLVESKVSSQKTIYKHLRAIKSQENRDKKEKCLKLISEGLKTREVAKAIGKDFTTISRWVNQNKAKEDVAKFTGVNFATHEETHPSDTSSTFILTSEEITAHPDDSSTAENNNGGQPAGLAMPEFLPIPDDLSIDKKTKNRLTSFYDWLLTAKITPGIEDFLVSYLIPLIAKKSPAVDNLIKNSGYAYELKDVKKHYLDLKSDCIAFSQSCAKAQQEVEVVKAKLRLREEHCDIHCKYSLKWAAIARDRALEAMLRDLRSHDAFLSEVDTDGMYDDEIAAKKEAFKKIKRQYEALLEKPGGHKNNGNGDAAARKEKLAQKSEELALANKELRDVQNKKNSLYGPAYEFMSLMDEIMHRKTVTVKTIHYFNQFEALLKETVFGKLRDIVDRTKEMGKTINYKGDKGGAASILKMLEDNKDVYGDEEDSETIGLASTKEV